MKKKLFIILLTLVLLILTACPFDDSIYMAAYYIQNKSQFQVTEIIVSGRTRELRKKDILEHGENCILVSEWVESNETSTGIKFYMNGEEYGCMEKESITDTKRFKPYKRIKNGDTVNVKIYDDHWEW
jgi:hypothetical protein